MTPMEFNAYWDETYSGSVPISYLLRDAYPNRWVRFHSLPESKRYAESEAEYQIILDRHNSVIDALATQNEELVLVSATCSETPTPISHDGELSELNPSAECWRTIAKHILEDDEAYPNYCHLHMSKWTWKRGLFDSILKLVADCKVADIMIVSTSQHWIYHPYDGGADVILHSSDERDQLQQKFRNWLSARADGM